jgi:hypothetical protein
MMNHLKILEVLPSCKEVIIALLPLFILQCPPFATSLDPNCFSSNLLLLPFVPYRWFIFTSFSSTSTTEYVLNHSSIAKCLKLSFQQVVIHPDQTPNKRVTLLLLCWCKLSWADIRMCDAQRFGCKFLHGSPKMLILDALESRLNGALEYPIFFFFTSLNMFLILMKTAVLFRDLKVLMTLISAFITNSWEWFTMRAK